MAEDIRVEFRSENGTGSEQAQVLVYEGKKLIARVVGTIEPKQGADGGFYPCITFKMPGVAE